MKTKDLGRGAILCALLTLGLWAAGLLPTGRAAALCVLSLAPGVWLRRDGRGIPLAILGAVILGFFLCTNRNLWTTYALAFAWYAPLYVATEKLGLRGFLLRLLAGQGSLAALGVAHCVLLKTVPFFWWLIPAGELGLLLWDGFFTLCVKAYDAAAERGRKI